MLDRPGVLLAETPGNYGSLARSVRRGAACAVGGGTVGAFCGRQPLAKSVRHLLAFCDLQRPREGRGRTAGALGRGRRPRISGSTRRRSRRATAWSAGARWSRRSSPSRPSTARATARVRLLRQPDGACASLDDFDLARFRRHLRRARRGRREHPTSAISPGPTGSSSGRPPPAMTTAIPTCSSSAAAMPAFRWRSKLNRIGLTALVVDREARIGDNWRLRYRGLKLHNKTPVNHLRYLPFPVDLSGLHPEGQDRELAGKLCRHHGGRLLDAHRVRRR